MDTVSTEKRREIMQRIRSTNSKAELQVRSALHASGFRFRIHNKKLPGTPDIVLPKYRTVIMVHGCFWHRHQNCRLSTVPKTNTEFWIEKFDRNVQRDQVNLEKLKDAGFEVIVLWECELRSSSRLEETLSLLDAKRRKFQLKASVASVQEHK
ncbi:MAG: DNA mismatch endonuclease Vsr [Gammaproteobacteria bacterium]|nr:DNA mismatch endonuclease Vsr [Gammaproteobacteria bacterium]